MIVNTAKILLEWQKLEERPAVIGTIDLIADKDALKCKTSGKKLVRSLGWNLVKMGIKLMVGGLKDDSAGTEDV